jgi:hypothetical protein
LSCAGTPDPYYFELSFRFYVVGYGLLAMPAFCKSVIFIDWDHKHIPALSDIIPNCGLYCLWGFWHYLLCFSLKYGITFDANLSIEPK